VTSTPASSSNPTPLIPRPLRRRPPRRRQHVMPELRSAEQHNAGFRKWRIPAFKRDRAGAGFARLDGGKSHRGCARNTQNRALLVQHRGSPGRRRFSQRLHRPKRPGPMCKIAHFMRYPRYSPSSDMLFTCGRNFTIQPAAAASVRSLHLRRERITVNSIACNGSSPGNVELCAMSATFGTQPSITASFGRRLATHFRQATIYRSLSPTD
jgi:hypothetical protein